ncbi:MAG: SDR family oxidoreductase [Acidobacteria bacterium]|nr:SDR family oxidoreductase [Acidobacteriota bacterium]MCH8990471.1 SDR family oxidoreductase [Acidobacteriota bacterium]
MSGKTYLEGHTALVTASSRNLGASIVKALANAGADVLVTYHKSMDKAEELIAGLPAGDHAAVYGDTSHEGGIRAMVDAAVAAAPGPIDLLINNSGPFTMESFVDLDPSEWDRIWTSNVKAAYLTSRLLVPEMLGWGRVVNVSAGSAYVRNHSIYTLAKDALITFTEGLAVEVAPDVNVNCVAPGQIAESADDMAEFDPTFVERATRATPLGRLVTRDEVAAIVAELCGPRFDVVTGVTIPIDGGWRLAAF